MDHDIAARLKQARTKAGFTQADVAVRLKKTQSLISKIESAERKVNARELAILAKIYGRPASYFLK